VDVAPIDVLRPYLPDGSRQILQAGHLPTYSPALHGQALHARVGFYVSLEAGQEEVAPADKMWRIARGDVDNYGGHASFYYLQFHENVTEAQLASFVTSLLQL
jgi:hypothetical protein